MNEKSHILSFILDKNKHPLNFIVYQNGENAKSKWSLFCRNGAT